MELLLRSLRAYLGTGSLQDLAQICGGQTAWEDLREQARAHRVTPLVYHALARLPAPTVPATVVSAFRLQVNESTVRELGLVRQLLDLLALLEAHRIPAIALKGPAMAIELYGNAAVRSSVDLDLLLPAGDIETARTLLVGRGYTDPTAALRPRAREILLSDGCELHLLPPTTHAPVELHWRLASVARDFFPDLHSLWQRSTTVTVGERQVPILAPQDLILYLCLHGTKHNWGQLILLCDLARAIQTYDHPGWTALLARAEANGARRRMAIGLILVQDLFGVELPPDVRRWISADTRAVEVAARIRRRLLAGVAGDFAPWPGHYFQFASMERQRDRRRYVQALVRHLYRPDRLDFEFVTLPAALEPLYFAVRPVRYLWKYGRLMVVGLATRWRRRQARERRI